MKTIKFLLSVCFMALLVNTAFADERSHRKLAEEFMTITDTAKMMGSSFEQIKSKQIEKLAKVTYPGKNPEKDRELQKRTMEYLNKKLIWNNFSEGYIDVYAEVFTEDELKALVNFYSSPVGKKVMSNTHDLRMKLLQSTQVQLKGMSLEIKKIEKDFVAEQKKQRE